MNRKRVTALDTSNETEDNAVSDDDFQNESVLIRRPITAEKHRVQQANAKRSAIRRRHQFLDEEAELLDDDDAADVSSDEEDGEDQNQSLEGFVVDNSHFSQGLNDSEMQGIYLKSVRSPAVRGKFKMSHRNHHNMDIFSQVPEVDETYAEDSFVVGSDEEELENSEEDDNEEEEGVELLPEESYVDGRRQYATRRRVFLHKARAGAETKAERPLVHRGGVKAKRARVIRVEDSSDEETEQVSEDASGTAGGRGVANLSSKSAEQEQKSTSFTSSTSTIASKVSLLSKAQRGATVPGSSSSSSLVPQPQMSTSRSPAPPGPVYILVDSRCLSGGVELMTSLRQRHSASVHICSLDGGYFIVSNRMAVERHSQSDLASMQNRKRLVDRVGGLQGLFERVCLIIEKDRTKPGEASRPFQRTRYYDSTVAALVRSGVRLLWSGGAEESAGLLAELAKLEQRKAQGITVPLEVKGQHRQQALQLYLSLPSVNYVHALNMSHNFGSVAQLINR
uniref:ERCC4 domain-containing protein n=1 Tax=Sphaeramia orbicularis TaxID=375764 RepID=A0A672ZVL5_9TELE